MAQVAECHACKASKASAKSIDRCSMQRGYGKPLDMAGTVADIVRSVLECSETVWTAEGGVD